MSSSNARQGPSDSPVLPEAAGSPSTGRAETALQDRINTMCIEDTAEPVLAKSPRPQTASMLPTTTPANPFHLPSSIPLTVASIPTPGASLTSTVSGVEASGPPSSMTTAANAAPAAGTASELAVNSQGDNRNMLVNGGAERTTLKSPPASITDPSSSPSTSSGGPPSLTHQAQAPAASVGLYGRASLSTTGAGAASSTPGSVLPRGTAVNGPLQSVAPGPLAASQGVMSAGIPRVGIPAGPSDGRHLHGQAPIHQPQAAGARPGDRPDTSTPSNTDSSLRTFRRAVPPSLSTFSEEAEDEVQTEASVPEAAAKPHFTDSDDEYVPDDVYSAEATIALLAELHAGSNTAAVGDKTEDPSASATADDSTKSLPGSGVGTI